MNVLRSIYAATVSIALLGLFACSGGDQATDTPPPNTQSVVADAGQDQSVFVGRFVTLNGSKSTNTNQTGLTYAWILAKPATSNATLSNSTSVNPTLTVDVEGTYEATLIVTDAQQPSLSSAPDTVLVIAAKSNLPPTADAGDNRDVFVGQPVSLDGSGSRASGNKQLAFNWSFSSMPAGSNSTLSDQTKVAPSFTPDKPGPYVLRLVVNDGTNDSTPASVTITAAVKPRPTANAGSPQSAKPNTLITLDGSKSSAAPGFTLTFSWSLTRPDGSPGTLANANTKFPTFTADKADLNPYIAQLIVNDGTSDSAPTTVQITITADAPVAQASASPNDVRVCRTVTLDGKKSTDRKGVENSPSLSYEWTLVSRITPPGTSNAKLDDPKSNSPTFTPDFAGSYDVSLKVAEDVNAVQQSNSTPTLTVLVNSNYKNGGAPTAWTNNNCASCHSFSGTDNPDGDQDLSREGFRIGVRFPTPPPNGVSTGNNSNHAGFTLTQNDIYELCDFFQAK